MPPPRLNLTNNRSLDGDHVWKTLDAWSSSYWSGLDSRIYADKVLLEEIISLSWQMMEPVMPCFGYSDYTYSSVVRGARHLQGSFQINFKRSSFIFELLQTLAAKQVIPPNIAKSIRETNAFRRARDGTATLEEFVSLAGGSTPQADAQGRVQFDPTLFEKTAADFEKAIWGVNRNTHGASSTQSVTNPALGNPFSFSSPKFVGPRGGFDLNIEFTSVDPSRLPRQQAAGAELSRPGQVQEGVAQTSRRLLGVELMGVETMVDDSGRPILESYSFLARDLV